VLHAAALFQLAHEKPDMAAEVLRKEGLTTAHCAELDVRDREALREINRSPGMSLTGLD
jgi:hypothetical protein